MEFHYNENYNKLTGHRIPHVYIGGTLRKHVSFCLRHNVIMALRKCSPTSNARNAKKKGCGLLNKLVNKLPVELHLPGYNYCGPGTKLSKRLQRGDKGVNPLDEACKEHDIAYSKFQDVERRNQADRELAEIALKRVKAPDSGFGEKVAALGVGGVMKLKSKLGMGLKRRRSHASKKKKKKGGQINVMVGVKKKSKSKKRRQRILDTPKIGGFLPLLLPLLGALGAIGGGAAGIAKAVNDAKSNREQVAEQKRHNLAMEQATKGKGLYLGPYKKGSGLYLKTYPKNSQ